MKVRAKNIFTTVRSEGSILPTDLLQRIVDNDKELKGLTPAAYHLLEGEKLNEAINRSWSRLRGAWASFQGVLETLPATDLAMKVTRDRILLPLFQELGYGRLTTTRAVEIEGKAYPISHLWQNTPIHLVGYRVELDKRTAGVAGASRSSPHSLVQEFLNRSDDHLWAFVSNGRQLRILRDNASLTRQAYVEFDLEAMMAGEVYADFVLLWLLCHQSRVEAEKPEQCWLEVWSKTANDQGKRALEALRDGVEAAIASLGQGFLTHPANSTLRQKLQSGELATQDYYRQLLRLVYRLLFLFVAEDRELLLDPNAEPTAKDRYILYYSTARLRTLAEKRRGTRHSDLFHGLRLVMEKLGSDQGCPALALPALGSFLWSSDAVVDLLGDESCQIANTDLLNAIRALAFIVDKHGRRPVDYKNLQSEELGSVYESLLELHPELNISTGTFSLKTASGNERKTTGSYYTPESLVQCLLDSALDPVVDEAIASAVAADDLDAETALLNLKICDPACGSGHFLIAAAHRLAKRLAFVRTGDEEPAPEATQTALRDVIGRCIYGVDVNPMAVELCKVALWMEALEPGKPLSFLDHHIRCGNSLLGSTPALLHQGIPDEAFKPIEGDDNAYCTKYRKQNKEERKGQLSLLTPDLQPWDRLGDLATSMAQLDNISDDDYAGVQRKRQQYEAMVQSTPYLYSRFWADAWCAAFVWKQTSEFPYPITEEVFRRIERNPHGVDRWMRDEVERLRDQYQFFHWHLAFPDVFQVENGELGIESRESEQNKNLNTAWSGGFDVALGNPPWDKIQPEEQKFFSAIKPEIAKAKTGKARKRIISNLAKDDPSCLRAWINYKRHIEGTSQILKQGRVLRLTTTGNLNTYRLFSEVASLIISSSGRAGMIVQSGIASDESGGLFFQSLLKNKTLVSLLDFENRGKFFEDVHAQFRFALLTIKGFNAKASPQEIGRFGWSLDSIEEISEKDRLIQISAKDVFLFNPNSGTCPTFKSNQDLEINRKIYQKAEHISNENGQRFSDIDFQGELFNMTRDSGFFVTHEERDSRDFLPLYEAKFIHQFDHRFADQVDGKVEDISLEGKLDSFSSIRPKRYIAASEVRRRAKKQEIDSNWMIGFRDISSSTNERTAIACIFPFSGVGNSINLVKGLNSFDATWFVANCNNFAFDYACRQKVSGSHVNIWIMRQLPIVPKSRYYMKAVWDKTQLSEWIFPRSLELTYTAWDLQPFAQDCGYEGPPFKWDEDRRFLLRCELDAAYFHLYGIQRDDVDYIMDTFPIVKRKDEKAHGHYRTKDTILQIYDAMATAIASGQPYQTFLDPPPADPRVAHPPKVS
jgi:hypothetical protein